MRKVGCRVFDRTPRSWVPWIPALLSVVVSLPALVLPFSGDDFYILEQAVLSVDEPRHFLSPWMGGIFRPLPKLFCAAGLCLWGSRPWVFHLINSIVHGLTVWLVYRGVMAWTRSGRMAFWTSLLFGLGIGSNLWAIWKISNITMLSASCFFLAALVFLCAGRKRVAGVWFLAALLCHEQILCAVFLWPFLADARAEVAGGDQVRPVLRPARLAVFLLILAAAALAGRMASMAWAPVVLRQSAFLLFPINSPERILDIWPALQFGLGAVPLRAACFLVEHQFGLGLAILAVLLLALPRSSRELRLAVAWTYIFMLPSALLIAYHLDSPLVESGWLERRYLYLPGLGLAFGLAAVLTRWRQQRPRLAKVALLLVVFYWLFWDLAAWDSFRRMSCGPWAQAQNKLWERSFEDWQCRKKEETLDSAGAERRAPD